MELRARLALALACLVAGCETEVRARTDAGRGDDANVERGDAGPAPDAGSFDAGSFDAGSLDAGSLDAGPSGDAGPVGDTGPSDAGPAGPLVYPYETRHSPIDRATADALRARAATRTDRADDVFAKVGDSITVNTAFLGCYVNGPVDLDGRDELTPTIAYFRAGDAVGTDPFRRVSLAAGIGWSASAAIAGTPSPLAQELTALTPRFASLMYGTNDVGFVDVDSFGRNMRAIVDAMLADGTLAILSSIPPRDDDAGANARVPIFNALVRGLAASRGLPFVDFHRELLPLASHGLAGDGVHPQSSMGGCVLTAAGLRAGTNVRNLIVLEALERLRQVVILGTDALDASAPRLAGDGTLDAPFVITSLPFAGHLDTRTMGETRVARWDGCSTADESGPEVRFRFHLDARTAITAVVSSGAGADLDVHVVPAGSTGACSARDNRQVDLTLDAGDWELVIDTYAGASGPLPGEGLVAVLVR